MNIKCRIGLHDWSQNRDSHITDIHAMFQQGELTRKCAKCGKTQYWLSGCGGSELGCWETAYKMEGKADKEEE